MGVLHLHLFSLLYESLDLTSTLKMIFSSELLLVTAIFLLNFQVCCSICARAEYEINGECCPMCAPGSRVYQHCTEDTSTTCAPCLESTYTAVPNGLIKCLVCSECDSGRGLKTKTNCTRFSDTICEPLEGHYCSDQYKGSCVQAVEYTKCSPGQYIKSKGTTLQDAECARCTDGYSDGTFQVCQPHLKCEELGLTEIKPGTNSSNVECGRKAPVHLIVGLCCFVFVLIIVITIGVLFKMKNKIVQHSAQGDGFIGNEDNEDHSQATVSSLIPILQWSSVTEPIAMHLDKVASA